MLHRERIMARGTFNCTECKEPYKGKVTVRWPINQARYANVCLDCLDKLVKEEKGLPPIGEMVRGFISWYKDNRMLVPATTLIRQQKERIEELERLVKEQARLLEIEGRQKGSAGR